MTLALLALASALCGFVLAWLVKPAPDRFLRSSRGAVPYWRADAVAEKVALNLAVDRASRKDADEVLRLTRAHRVIFVDRPFDAHEPWKPGMEGVAVWKRGLLYVQAGAGWEGRLAEALSQSLRLQLRGDVDRHGADHAWNAAARRGFGPGPAGGPALPNAGDGKEAG